MSNLATKPKSQLVAAVERYRGSIARAKEQAKAVGRRTINGGLTVGSGYAVGMARNKFGAVEVPGTEVPADLAIGCAATAIGLMGWADDYSDAIVAVGSGTLAGCAAIYALQS